MAAYIIADIEVTDKERYLEYTRRVPETIARHGGRFVVRGGAHETLEGTWHPGRLVVLEFESVAAAREWWGSDDYRELRNLRQSASIGSLVVVEGAIPGSGPGRI